MEASGTTPPAEPAAPATAPPPSEPVQEKAGGGKRALAVLLGLVLLFAAGIMIAVMVDLSGTPLKDECQADPTCTEYFDGSDTAKTITVILGFASGAFGAIAALLAFYYAATSRLGRTMLQLAGVAVVLGALSLAIG